MSRTDRITEALRDYTPSELQDAHRQREPVIQRWFLFHGDRKYVTIVLLVAVLGGVLALGAVWPIEFERLITETGVVQTVFNTLLGGVILLVSIVVAVASVGISQELIPLADQRERIQTALDFQGDIRRNKHVKSSPGRPGQVIAVSLQSVLGQMQTLHEITYETADSDLQEELNLLKEDIEVNVEELAKTIETVSAGTTDELLVGLDYNCSWQLHTVYRLKRQYSEQLSEEELDALDQLGETLEDFMASREYFKTIYYKQEFSGLSTMLLVTSLPVIVYITYVLLAIDAWVFPEVSILGLSPLGMFISASFTIALIPYVILTSYLLRAASVTKRTPAVGPFVLDTEHHTFFQADLFEKD